MYNEALQELIDHYKETGKFLHRREQDNLHNTKRHPELPAYVVDEVLNRLHRAFSRFFVGTKKGRKEGFPRFKKATRWRSFSMSCNGPQDHTGMKLHGSQFYAGRKMGGKIRVSLQESPKGKQKIAHITHRASGWYLYLVSDYEKEQLEPNDKAIGLDFGIKNLIADSDGNFVENPQFYKKSLNKLRIAQRKVERRKEGSNRRKKAYRIAARINEKIASQRRDYLHKISRKYVNEYGIIVVEDLHPENLARNKHMARTILDSGWGILRKYLEVKAESAGRQVIRVNPHYTSQKCSKCGEIVQKSLSVRTHVCTWCGYVADRDVNAAKNILRAGVRPSGANVEDVISCVA
jgi:putative transposase